MITDPTASGEFARRATPELGVRRFGMAARNALEVARKGRLGAPYSAPFEVEHEDRVAVVLTDMGHPRREVADALSGAHVLVLEFNHDVEGLANGPYPPVLQNRIGGDRGHLSNEQAARMLEWLAGPELHTLVLAHLSKKTNTAERAEETARRTLDRLGLGHVEVHVASQDEVGPNLRV